MHLKRNTQKRGERELKIYMCKYREIQLEQNAMERRDKYVVPP